MGKGLQINQELFDDGDDLFVLSDEDFGINFQDLCDIQEEVVFQETVVVQKEVVVQECAEIIIKSSDIDYSTNVNTILETEVESLLSTVDVDIPISECEVASSPDNPHVINHMLTNHTNNISDSSKFTIPVHSWSVTHGEGSENKDYIYHESNTKNINSSRKGRDKCDSFKAKLHSNTKLECIEEKTYKCIDCKPLLKSLPESELHTEQHLKIPSFPSKSKYLICDGQIEGSNELSLINQNANHVKTNSILQDSSIIFCDVCFKVFSTISAKNVHIRKHTGERPYNCKYCDKSFADTSTRKKHERLHTQERPYACPACTMTFIQKIALRKHIKLYHAGYKKSDDVKLHKCDLCGFLSESSEELYLHLVKHSDENKEKFQAKYHSKLGNQKKSCTFVSKTMTSQSTMDICEDITVPTEDSSRLSKYTVLESEIIPKKQCFVLKDGECTRTCSTVLYYSSRSNSNVMIS